LFGTGAVVGFDGLLLLLLRCCFVGFAGAAASTVLSVDAVAGCTEVVTAGAGGGVGVGVGAWAVVVAGCVEGSGRRAGAAGAVRTTVVVLRTPATIGFGAVGVRCVRGAAARRVGPIAAPRWTIALGGVAGAVAPRPTSGAAARRTLSAEPAATCAGVEGVAGPAASSQRGATTEAAAVAGIAIPVTIRPKLDLMNLTLPPTTTYEGDRRERHVLEPVLILSGEISSARCDVFVGAAIGRRRLGVLGLRRAKR
jgi:hypothetical protein